ncbi:hypothetical protein AB0P17_29600 [Streptomyces sp. NPDC088124]|uniref:hypothetical protein n=1 Tax=Streptomyces sp. NPDC088124 TaxID=3154654 RepID=UPI0034313BA4
MTVVGYSYQAENLCPNCTLRALRANGVKVQRGKPHEDAIRRAAQNLGIDFDSDGSYDSGDFPKPVSKEMCETELTDIPNAAPGVRHAISDERCTGEKCGKWLVLGERSPTEPALIRHVRDTYELPQALARKVAVELRSWGLSHPTFISEDNVHQAAAMHPHGYATVHLSGQSGLGLMPTPEYDGDRCLYCEQLWEKHLFTCETCGIDVPADQPHRHQLQVKNQRTLPGIKPKGTGSR